MIRILILLLFSYSSFGQIDTSKVKIEKQFYHGSHCKEKECFLEDSVQDTNIASLGKVDNADSVFAEIINITCPIIITSNPKLDKFINDTIEKVIGIHKLIRYHECNSSENWSCLSDKPDILEKNFNVTFFNTSFLSLTISEDWEACCGASGANHNQTAFAFDLTKRELLTLKNIIKKGNDSTLYNIAIAQLRKSIPQFFSEYAKIDNPSLINFRSLLDDPFVISKNKITIYWSISAGGRGFDEPIDIYFDGYPNLFLKSFLVKVKQ